MYIEEVFRSPQEDFVQGTDKLVVAVSQHTVFLAEAAIAHCGACSLLPGIPFSEILGKVGSPPSGPVEYILPVLGHCPCCQAVLNESTIVIPKS